VLASASYSEPSLVFEAGRNTKLVDAAAAADYLAGHQSCGLALIGGREQAAFHARMQALGVMSQALAQVAGINYSTGRQLDLTIYAAKPP
jgi:ornithine cyclodeaminase/alanine dehydrogenase-like protein (mu-crystallin family)